jgi:hypothetical protein
VHIEIFIACRNAEDGPRDKQVGVRDPKYLVHLVCFGFAFCILNIAPGITLPRGFIDAVTTALLPGVAKIKIAHLA